MLYGRALPSLLMMVFAIASGARDLPPVPTKILPLLPGGITRGVTSPLTHTVYAIRVEPDPSDNDAGEEVGAKVPATPELGPTAKATIPSGEL
jgi:hypothetical protein